MKLPISPRIVLLVMSLAAACAQPAPVGIPQGSLGQPSPTAVAPTQRASRIVFESYRDGNAELYVMRDEGSGQTRLTNHPGGDQNPAWSPDCSKIAFHSNR